MPSFLPGGAGVGLPEVDGMKLGINYGWNKVRFMNPVQVGAKDLCESTVDQAWHRRNYLRGLE